MKAVRSPTPTLSSLHEDNIRLNKQYILCIEINLIFKQQKGKGKLN